MRTYLFKKIDSTGKLTWIKTMGGTSFDAAESISLDNHGHLLSTGMFQKAVDWDPSTRTFYKGSNGSTGYIRS